ncbi:MAG: MSMEG_1061 family FMN-dependent PPOX-type flavoprotein [Burkholderiales bacterium]
MALIGTVDRLVALIGEPKPAVAKKFNARLTPQAREFLARSPLAFVATVDTRGVPMVSPKGDVPGFIRIEDETTLLVPERHGNRLVYTLRNIIETGSIAVTAVVPGTGETLRIEGRGELDDDAALCARFTARNRPALLVMRIRISRTYFHCAKSLLRSNVWDPASWPEALRVSFGREIAANQGLAECDVDAFDAGVAERYRTDL